MNIASRCSGRYFRATLLALSAASTCAAAPSQSPLARGEAWSDYHAIIWQPQKAGSCAALKELGIDARAFIPQDRERPAESIKPLIESLSDCGLTWYVENIATDFYSAYHRYSPGKPVNWRFVEIMRAYQNDPQNLRAFMRDPSLSDPEWQKKIHDRLTNMVRAYRAYQPLFYNLADEPGIAGLSAFWDFDFSPHSLAGMRRWLRGRYGSLAALNHQWGSRFIHWNSVVPMTTAEAMKRSDGNYSAWADFKEWMDVEFARAIERGTRAIHDADPGAYSAIEGGQIPGWGGYDYSRLANAVDLMELYDDGGNVEIARSLNPNLVLLKTSADRGALEIHGIWRSLLRGGRGVIFWDPERRIVDDDGRPADRGNRVAPHLREIKSGLGALLIHSRRQVAPIALLYSPPSMRMQWMLDWQPKGRAWSDRDPSDTYEDKNSVRASMMAFLDFLGRVGLEPRVLTPHLVEQGALQRGIRVLILPRALALSRREAAEVDRFAANGGTVISDGIPGRFDQHGRQLAKPLLARLFRKVPRPGKGAPIVLDSPPGDHADELMNIIAAAGVEPAFTLTRSDGGRALNIETQLWRNGTTSILALQREPGESSGQPETVLLTLRNVARAYDLRAGIVLGTTKRLELTLDPITPTLLALSTGSRPPPAITGARRLGSAGATTVTFSLPRSEVTTVPDPTVLRVELVDPRGEVRHSENLFLRSARIAKRFHFAPDTSPGKWQIRATDVLTGNSVSRTLEMAVQ